MWLVWGKGDVHTGLVRKPNMELLGRPMLRLDDYIRMNFKGTVYV